MNQRKIFEELRDFYNSVGDTYRVRAYDVALATPERMGAKLKEKASAINQGIVPPELHQIRKIKKFAEIRGVGKSMIKKLLTVKNLSSSPTKALTQAGITITDGLKYSIKYHKQLSTPIPRAVIESYHQALGIGTLVGSYRRGKQTSGDIDILTTQFPNHIPGYLATLSKGKQKMSVLVKWNNRVMQVDILKATKESWSFALLYFTGSKEFNIAMRSHAKKNGYTLSEHGLKRYDGTSVHATSEQEIFNIINYKWVQPANR